MFKRVLCAVVMVAIFSACEDENTAVAPDPPPQITVKNRWLVSYNSQGKQTSLHTNDVYDILVTTEGEVWMGTSGGIAVFKEHPTKGAENTRVRAFTNTNGLPNPKIRRMIELNGKIYVATWGGGVGVYDMADSTWSKLPFKRGSLPGLINGLVNDMKEVNGIIHFATNAGVSRYNPVTETWSDFAKSQGLSYPTYNNKTCSECPLKPLVYAVDAGTTSRGLEVWYGPRVDFGLSPDKQANYGVTVDLPGPNIIYKINPNGLPELAVNDIYFDPDTEHFWLTFGTKGVAEVDVDTGVWTRHTMVQGLPSNVVYSIAKVDGRFWVGTQAGVAAQRDDGRWQGYGRGASLKEVRVRRVYSDDGVRLWAATIEGGVMLLDPNAEGI